MARLVWYSVSAKKDGLVDAASDPPRRETGSFEKFFEYDGAVEVDETLIGGKIGN